MKNITNTTKNIPVKRSLRKLAFAFAFATCFIYPILGIILTSVYGSMLSIVIQESDAYFMAIGFMVVGIILIVFSIPQIIFTKLNYDFINNPNECLTLGVVQIIFGNIVSGILVTVSGGKIIDKQNTNVAIQ